jgi:hypothetical protein
MIHSKKEATLNQGTRRRQAGQALVFMTVAMIASLAMVAMIIDGGNAWAQQRVAQNGADSAADGGATVLGQRLAGQLKSSAEWDSKVHTAVVSNWDANITHPVNDVLGYYTDICGTLLTPGGQKASGTGSAAQVGSGSLPSEPYAAAPNCADTSGLPGRVAGVMAVGSQTFNTFIAQILGQLEFTATADATAVTGYLSGCPTDTDTNCIVLPIAFPVTLVSCDNAGKAVVTSTEWTYDARVILPICKYNGGNFGWLDWSPPNGGSSELVYCLNNPSDESVCFPTSTSIPTWLEAAQQGNPSNSTLEAAINQWAYALTGQTILIPLWDEVCATDPGDGNSCSGQTIRSPSGNQNFYHITKFGIFELEVAYTNGSNTAECNPAWSPDGGSNDCIIGKFESFITSGTVFAPGAGAPSKGAVGIQLIH